MLQFLLSDLHFSISSSGIQGVIIRSLSHIMQDHSWDTWHMSSPWLQMSWQQIGPRSSATIMMTCSWSECHMEHYITHITQHCQQSSNKSTTCWFLSYWLVNLLTFMNVVCWSSVWIIPQFERLLPGKSSLIYNVYDYTPRTTKLLGGILVSLRPSVRLSVCPSVRPSVRPACRVRSVSSTVMDGFFSY